MDPGLCPDCAGAGRVSRLEYLIHDDMNLILCEDNDCNFNYRGQFVLRNREDSPLPAKLLDQLCSDSWPATLLREPKLKYRHLMKLFWFVEMRKSDVYCWLQEEIMSMRYSRLERVKYRQDAQYKMTPSAKQMLELTDEEVEIGKHVIPDLRKIITTLKVQYEIHLSKTRTFIR
nr:uncharacterized protein LOC106680885 [Halyomorpha halys]XP_014276368.1 uncharacterized protein LOC106680885 [Halyomorpha halys]XP_014276369.1 uncharacterized protein LOC106680885 [Halyomorpha halys]XP_014276370.1 uncharacterized protein LOC106680885 [Halyomorpha halys]